MTACRQGRWRQESISVRSREKDQQAMPFLLSYPESNGFSVYFLSVTRIQWYISELSGGFWKLKTAWPHCRVAESVGLKWCSRLYMAGIFSGGGNEAENNNPHCWLKCDHGLFDWTPPPKTAKAEVQILSTPGNGNHHVKLCLFSSNSHELYTFESCTFEKSYFRVYFT